MFNHVFYDVGAVSGSSSLKCLKLNVLGPVFFIRNGTYDNKRGIVQTAGLRHGCALHLGAHAAKTGYYLILLFTGRNKLIS